MADMNRQWTREPMDSVLSAWFDDDDDDDDDDAITCQPLIKNSTYIATRLLFSKSWTTGKTFFLIWTFFSISRQIYTNGSKRMRLVKLLIKVLIKLYCLHQKKIIRNKRWNLVKEFRKVLLKSYKH